MAYDLFSSSTLQLDHTWCDVKMLAVWKIWFTPNLLSANLVLRSLDHRGVLGFVSRIFRNVSYMFQKTKNITYPSILCLWPECIQNKKKVTVLDSSKRMSNDKTRFCTKPRLNKHLDSIWSIGISKMLYLLTDFNSIGKTSVLCCP